MDNMEIATKTKIGFKSLLIVLIIIGAIEVFDLDLLLYNKETSSNFNVTSLAIISNVTTRNTSVQNRLKGFNKMMLHHEQKCFNLKQCKKDRDLNSCPAKPHSTGKFECSHFMTFPRHLGRTGNQLFQVAVLLGTAMYHGYTPLVDPSLHIKEYFVLPNLQHFKHANQRKFTTQTRGFDERISNLSHGYNWTLRGYMNSWKYFEGADMTIRKALTLKQNLVAKANEFMKHVVPQGTTTVCVHVRRGDYLKEEYQKEGRVVAPVRYIKDAMTRFKQNFTQIHFVILSDDKMWCKENLNWENVTLSNFDSPGLDMALMSLCDNTIMTAGTFGWWGAWLAGGDVIYWSGYPRKGSWLDKMIDKSELFPKGWIGLP